MSSSGKGGFRVSSIPNSVKKTIQHIKEIVNGNHSDEEIYAMLKECSMDPNETAQKLLLQDPFHEVKRKRDRRKENTGNKDVKESVEPRRPNMQASGSRGGRTSYSHRHSSHDAAGVGRNSASGKGLINNLVSEKAVSIPPSPTTQESKNKETVVAGVLPDGLTSLPSSTTSVTHATPSPGGGGPHQLYLSSNIAVVENSASTTLPTSSAVCFSSSDPVLVPSNDSRLPGAVGTIKRKGGSQRTPDAVVGAESKSTSAISENRSVNNQGNPSGKFQAVGKNQITETSRHSPLATNNSSSISRPSSNHSYRAQQVIGPQKVAPSKEWKPKPTNANLAQGSGTVHASEDHIISVEKVDLQSESELSTLESEESTAKIQRKLGELRIQEHQHVIIPRHIHVPASVRSGLSFGSIDASFGINTIHVSYSETEKSSPAVSETSHGIQEIVQELPSSNQSAFATADEDEYSNHPQSPTNVPEKLSSVEDDAPVIAGPEYNESNRESALPHGGQHYSTQTSPNYGFGYMQPMLGSQPAAFENSDFQARDVSRAPTFMVQQPFDPASYYAQFYRSGTDSDGHPSPFPSTGVTAKYNGGMAVLSSQTLQNLQEGGNSLVLSTAGPTPLVTQAGGIPLSQQAIPVFRPPTGMHISHYPPNYIPYPHYFSPYYVPPPVIHQFMSNGAFPQQPQLGNVYAAPPSTAGAGIKYAVSQFKPGVNSGNSTQMGMPSGYGSYGSSPVGYNPSTTAMSGNSNGNEELAASQFKESNVYIPGQQSEGSAVWFAAPGRDMSNLPTNSFYNLPPQGGQHVTFSPSQAGPHGNFAGLYHPGQAVTATMVHPHLQQQQSQTMPGSIDMVGPPSNVYQQPQNAHMNWPSNY